MSLPVLLKTWNFSVNNNCTESDLTNSTKHAIHQLKASLVSFAQWSVVASCDSVSVKNIGDGSPDLWADWETDIVWAYTGSAHSWVILQNSVTGAQLCIDLAHTDSTYAKWYYSATGAFAADGTTTARPTDTESLTINDLQPWASSLTSGFIVNAMCSSDGKCTRVYMHQRSGSAKGGFFFALEDLAGTPALWTGTEHHAVLGMSTGVYVNITPTSQDPQATRFDSNVATNYIYQVGAGPYEGWNTAFATSECYHQWSNAQGNGITGVDINLEWNEGLPACPIGLFRNVATRGGGMGAFQDLYWAPIYHAALTAYPDDGSNLWVKWGGLIVPWNGSVPMEVP